MAILTVAAAGVSTWLAFGGSEALHWVVQPEDESAEVGLVICGEEARVHTPTVRVGVDGVHLEIRNAGGSAVFHVLDPDDPDDDLGGGLLVSGKTTTVRGRFPSGDLWVGCFYRDAFQETHGSVFGPMGFMQDAVSKEGLARLTVVDPEGLWTP